MTAWTQLVRLMCLTCTLLGCTACKPSAASSDSDKPVGTPEITLSIVSTNDVHGRISQLPLFGGYIENLRAERAKTGGALLLLDAGDIFQGTIESNATEGGAVGGACQALGFAAGALGNPGFAFGPVGPQPVPYAASDDPLGALKQRVEQAKFPFLNANLRGQNG